MPALRCIGNILVCSEEELANKVYEAGVLDVFLKVISHPKQLVRKDVVWSLSNVTAESAERVAQCI